MRLPEQVTHGDFLQGLPAASRARLEPLARDKHFPPGARIFAEGSLDDDVYLVAAGHVRLEMAVPPMARAQFLSLGPGDLLGWSPLLGDQPMTATAIALEPVSVVAFDGGALRRLCHADHEIGFHVMKQLAQALAQRLVATRLQLMDLYKDSLPRDLGPCNNVAGDTAAADEGPGAENWAIEPECDPDE